MADSVVLATVERNGLVESIHRGRAVIVEPSGRILQQWGNPSAPMYPRSSIKPLQAAAMVRLGLELPDDLTALSAASHNGEDVHIDGVRRILASAGLDESALQTPADYPLGMAARNALIAKGIAPEPVYMNCSGKHSAMLATCVLRGWSIDDYRDPEHSLQKAIMLEIEDATGDEMVAPAIDGCGAPLARMSLKGLARAVASCATAPEGSPRRTVADAMRSHPFMVGGTGRDVTAFMEAVPGLLAKDGAEGVYAAALPDGHGIAFKVDDGSDRARPAILQALLGYLGVDVPDEIVPTAVLGGGRPVGRISAVLA